MLNIHTKTCCIMPHIEFFSVASLRMGIYLFSDFVLMVTDNLMFKHIFQPAVKLKHEGVAVNKQQRIIASFFNKL